MEVFELLGYNTSEEIPSLERLRKKHFMTVKTITGFSDLALCRILSVSIKTIHNYGDNDQLSPATSLKLFKLAKLLSFGLEVVGSKETLREWLNQPLRLLNGLRPREILITPSGAETVKNLLGRIDNNVYS